MQIKVRVFPDAKKESLEEDVGGRITIFVREPPKNNLANRRVVEVVAAHFSVEPRRVRILTGHRSPNKLLEIGD